MYYKNKIQLLFLLFCILIKIGVSQDSVNHYDAAKYTQLKKYQEPISPTNFDKDKWETLKKKLKIKNYSALEKEDSTSNATNTIQKKDWSKSISKETVKNIQWMLFAIILLLLIYFILRVLGIHPFRKNNSTFKQKIELESLEENLDIADIDPHLYEAIKNKNFKLAIRLYYLKIIQKLALKEKIIWKKYKTNKHYINEIKDIDEYNTLKKITWFYEACWFSNSELDEMQYNIIQKEFVNFLQNIHK